MIVIAIIALLATLALPKYHTYLSKARQTEVAINLASLHTAEHFYWLEHNTYTTKLAGPQGIDWSPSGYKAGATEQSFYYTYGFFFPGAQEGVHYFVGKLKTPPRFLKQTGAQENSFIAGAVGLQKGSVCDTWSINEARTLTHDNEK